jgi:hypothetical protein
MGTDPFQSDYGQAWGNLVEGIGEVAEHRDDAHRHRVQAKEPRASYIDSAASRVVMSKIGCRMMASPST